ncbi:hypothetical protein WN943_020810 [Citrus x changshan-huyou]
MATLLGIDEEETVMIPSNAVNGVQVISQDHAEPAGAGCDCSRSRRFRRRVSRSCRPRYQRVAADNPLVFNPRVNRLPVQPPPPPPVREINPFLMRFLFEKQLKNSDVNAAGRIVLPKKLAETYLPPVNEKAGFWMHLEDMDFNKVWTFKFRFWPNNRGRMYIFENTRAFIKRYCLELGDYIMVYKDELEGSYLVRARKKGNYVPVHDQSNQVDNNANFPSINLEELVRCGNNYPKDACEVDTSDYAHLILTPCCESLDFAPDPPLG